MIGTRFIAPQSVVESEVIQVVGREVNPNPINTKILGGNSQLIYWCVEVVNSKTRGPAFAVSDSELAKWQEVNRTS